MNEIVYPRWRWFALIAMGAAAAATIANIVAPATLIGEIAKSDGISMGAAALATMGMLDLSTGLSGLVGGFLADRFGFGRIWLASFTMMIIGALLMPIFGHTFAGLAAVRLLQGCGAGPVIATLPMGAMRWFPPHNRGIVIGVQGTMVSVGAAGSLLFVPAVFQLTGQWTQALAWMAVFSGAGVLAALVMVLGPKPPVAEGAPDARGGHGALAAGELKRVLMLPATLGAMACGFFFTWHLRSFNDMIPAFLASDRPAGLGLGPMGAGSIMSVVQIAFMVGPLLGGLLTDKIFRGSARMLIMLGFLIASVSTYALVSPVVTSNPTLLFALLLTCGLTMSITSPQVMTFVVKSHPPHVIGRLGGLLMAFNILGGLVGVGAGSYALHVSGAYHWTIVLISLAPIGGIISAAFLVAPKRIVIKPRKTTDASGINSPNPAATSMPTSTPAPSPAPEPT